MNFFRVITSDTNLMICFFPWQQYIDFKCFLNVLIHACAIALCIMFSPFPLGRLHNCQRGMYARIHVWPLYPDKHSVFIAMLTEDSVGKKYTSFISVDCVWDEWSEWQPCNVSCGNGAQRRTRSRKPERFGGTPCYGADSDWQDCNPRHCPSMSYIILFSCQCSSTFCPPILIRAAIIMWSFQNKNLLTMMRLPVPTGRRDRKPIYTSKMFCYGRLKERYATMDELLW